jgi:hypothetical protein
MRNYIYEYPEGVIIELISYFMILTRLIIVKKVDL